MNQPQPGQQMAYQPVMYMPPSNTGSGYPVGQQIIVQPPNSLAQMPPSQLQQMGQQIIVSSQNTRCITVIDFFGPRDVQTIHM